MYPAKDEEVNHYSVSLKGQLEQPTQRYRANTLFHLSLFPDLLVCQFAQWDACDERNR
jgi:hypothetical protein